MIAAANVLGLLGKYRPESDVEKKQRRQKAAESEVKGQAKVRVRSVCALHILMVGLLDSRLRPRSPTTSSTA